RSSAGLIPFCSIPSRVWTELPSWSRSRPSRPTGSRSLRLIPITSIIATICATSKEWRRSGRRHSTWDRIGHHTLGRPCHEESKYEAAGHVDGERTGGKARRQEPSRGTAQYIAKIGAGHGAERNPKEGQQAFHDGVLRDQDSRSHQSQHRGTVMANS